MRIATLTLPLADNDKNPLHDVHYCLQADIVAQWGGFTLQNAQGGWKDDASGSIYIEPVAVYSIAMDATPENARKLRSLAVWHGKAASQIAVFIVTADGHADIVTVGALALA